MASKTSLLPLVRAFDWRAVAGSLDERPSLVTCRDERGRNWLHICCATPLDGRDPRPSLRTADVLLDRGIELDEPAFTEDGGRWRATPVWYSVAFGRNLKLTEHLLKKGAVPHHSLYAAAWNHDTAAIRLLVRHGADLEEPHGRGETPLLGAIGWSRFDAAEALLACGANVDHQDERGRTAAHLMLKKNSAYQHFAMLARYKARFDLPDASGTTAAEIMARKRDPRFRTLAAACR